jgi:hypothetical protein
MPGGLGTLDELFEAATLIQCRKIGPFPLILMGSKFWKGMREWGQDMMKEGVFARDEIGFGYVTDSPREAADLIRHGRGRFVTSPASARNSPPCATALTVRCHLSNSGAVARVYDLVMTHRLDADDLFIHRIQQGCAERGLNFFLIEPLWVAEFFENYRRGHVWARVLLNMHSEHHLPEEIYHRLIRQVADKGTQVIDPPETALAAFDKARLHGRMIGAGLNVPHTLIIPADRVAGWTLSDADREFLGTPFVVKPSLGYGRKGVILEARSEADLRRSAAAWPNPHYLLQRRVVPRQLNGAPAYFRVYYVFGSVWLAWWNCYTDLYRMVTGAEMDQHVLWPLESIVHRIAGLTGMKYFSSEVALTEANEFVVIDYVNDQCHMLSQRAHPHIGVPDELVRAVADRLVEATQQMIRP